MRPIVKKLAGITAVAAACIVAWPSKPINVNARLKERGIPEIPSYESCDGLESGGLFAAWLFTAVRVNTDQMAQYKALLVADGGEHLEIGNGRNQIKIVKIEDYELPKNFDADSPEIVYKESLHSSYLPWWNTELATSGDFFRKQLPKTCGYRIILDHDHGIIYIYWHYS